MVDNKVQLTIKALGRLEPIGRPYVLCDPNGEELWSHFCNNGNFARADLIRGNRLDTLNERYGIGGWIINDYIEEVIF
jgi:hypothetical protein